jgi:hypothetical protein
MPGFERLKSMQAATGARPFGADILSTLPGMACNWLISLQSWRVARTVLSGAKAEKIGAQHIQGIME